MTGSYHLCTQGTADFALAQEALADLNHATELDPGDDDYLVQLVEIQRLIGSTAPRG